MRKRVFFYVGVMGAALSGCAPQTWHKGGASSQDFAMDQGACQAQAFSIANAPPLQVAIIYNSCMRGHGWYLARDPS